MKEIFPGVFEKRKGRKRFLYTENLVVGETVYSERTIIRNRTEYRQWDPHKSKLAAAITKGLSQFNFGQGDSVLYLGSSTGTTVSHVSDIVKSKGRVFALDSAPRMMRELVFLARKRNNIIPILADAAHPKQYFHKIKLPDFLYQDIAQKHQAEVFLDNLKLVKNEGFGILCVKARSIDITKKPRIIFEEVRKKLEKHVKIVDKRLLKPFQKDHILFVCKKD
ncbi:MAG: Fibrillarin-like rRNA/tRNA 2'-O-methyltransferase [Candidatus Woesearchaeota archaeon]|nr:Fibrillarin-like rRNA/tRNA 2'-O-methyltransferase [Candidatus Woesearchaeota archaeon]